MPIAGHGLNSFEMSIKGGKVLAERQSIRQGVVTDVAEAVAQLIEGKTVFMHAYGNKVEQVTRTVEVLLANKKEGAA